MSLEVREQLTVEQNASCPAVAQVIAHQSPAAPKQPNQNAIAGDVVNNSEKVSKPEVKAKKKQSFSIEKLITEAIGALNEARGSSSVAIARYISKHYNGLDTKKKARISTSLKKMVARDKLVKVKASYKLPPVRSHVKSHSKRTVAASPRKLSSSVHFGTQFTTIRQWLLDRKDRFGSILIPAGANVDNIIEVPELSLDPREMQRREKEDAKFVLKQKRAQEREDAKKQRDKEREQKRIEEELKRRYPMEDSRLIALGEEGEELPVGEPLYIKHGFPAELFPDLLMISEALKVLETPLDLPELTLPLLRDELLKGSGCGGKLLDVKIKLTKHIVAQCAEPICGCDFDNVPLDAVSWAEVFRQFLLITDVVGSDVSLVCDWLESEDYHLLTLKQRMSVLSLLVNLGLELEEVREHLSQVVDRAAEITREWNVVRNDRRSKVKEGLTNVKKAQDAANAEKKAKLMAAKAAKAAAAGEGSTVLMEVEPSAEANKAPVQDAEVDEAQIKGENEVKANDEDQLDWKAYGHEWIGLRVRRAFSGRRNDNAGNGTITRWVPADESNPEEDPALWHVVHDDADEEDLDADEVREGLSLMKMSEDSQDEGFQARISEAQQELRFEPLGLDRHHCRYWLVDSETEFLRGCLVVQRPMSAPVIDDSRHDADDDGDSTASEDEPLIHEASTDANKEAPGAGTDAPVADQGECAGAESDGAFCVKRKSRECWRSFRKPEHVQELLDTLNEKGEREFHLQKNIKKRKLEMDTLLDPRKKSNILQAMKHSEGQEYDPDEEGTEDSRVLKMLRGALTDAERELEQSQIQTPDEEYHEAYKTFKHEVENADAPCDLRTALIHFSCHVKPSAMEELWPSSKAGWLQMCEEVNTAGQAGLVLSIFHTLMKGKKAAAVKLKKNTKPKQQGYDGNWCNKGHKWVGKTVRRNYGQHGHNVGEITRWMPADESNPEEDPALWHVMFDDGDEEDLDEAEVQESLKEFDLKGNVDSPSKEKKWKTKGHEWIGATVRVDFGEEGFSTCKVVKWASANKSRKTAVWLVVDDESEEHTLNKDQMEDGLEKFAEHEELSNEGSEDEGDDIAWQHKGHEWLNRLVLRDYGDQGTNEGTITKWTPANPDNPEEDVALWHVVFGDGDEEDLEETEVEEALSLHTAKGRRKRGAPEQQQENARPQKRQSPVQSTSDEDGSDDESETQSEDEAPTMSLSGRVRAAPQRFKAGPASATAK